MRGIGILLVVVYHFFFDLNYFGVLKIGLYDGPCLYFQRTTAVLMLFLVGVGLSLSLPEKRFWGRETRLPRRLREARYCFQSPALITLATWVYPTFGLHRVWSNPLYCTRGLGKLFFKNFFTKTLFSARCDTRGFLLKHSFRNIRVAGLAWSDISRVFTPWITTRFFPWLGVVLIGMFLGKALYPKYSRRFSAPIKQNKATNLLEFVGRNSLLIYLTHQLVLIGVIRGLFLLKIFERFFERVFLSKGGLLVV